MAGLGWCLPPCTTRTLLTGLLASFTLAASLPLAAAEPTPAPAPAPAVTPDGSPTADVPAPSPAPPSAPADDAEMPAVIIVEGHRRTLVAPPENPTRFVTQIELKQATESLDSVSDELEKTVGVTVRRLGGLGSFSTLSIRGSTPQQVEIFWDGVPLNRADSGLTNLEDIPMDLIERVEIYRGAAPAQFGAAGIGGVVNLVTRRPPPRTATGTGAAPAQAFGLVSVTAGSWDTWKTDLMLG
ncbi:MAG TPA: TonB-dependent receptor plug domain-containing protein, partial [Planctomycetota bacterium]|nr:TonB-dependent receptor plug domain-containing protein [Planctomycetota bacterium]